MSDVDKLVTYDTPWRCHAEFKKVYKLIYFSNSSSGSTLLNDLTLARNKILVWTMRCPNFKNKIELEVTLHFLNATIADKELAAAISEASTDLSYIEMLPGMGFSFEKGSRDHSSHGELMLPSLFCTAVVKFCDLLKFYSVDYGSVKRLASKDLLGSFVEKCEKLGIPEWVIDARHEASHATLPSLDLLRHASFICMDWLNRHFWRPKADRQLDCLVSTAVQEIVNRTDNFKTSCSFLTTCLTNDSAITLKLLSRILITMDTVPVPENFANDWSPSNQPLVPQAVLTSVLPILRRVFLSGQLHDLLIHLTGHFDSPCEAESKRSVLWFCQMIACMTTHKPKTCLTVHRKVLRTNLQFALEYKTVLHAVCMKPSFITRALVLHMAPLLPSAREAISQKLLPATESCHLTNGSMFQNKGVH